MGSGKNKSKLKLNSLDWFFSSKLDLEDVPFVSALDIDKVLECHDKRTNRKGTALNTLVIKETIIGEENKDDSTKENSELRAKVLKKEKRVTTVSKDVTHLRAKVFRNVTVAEMHGNSQNKTLTGLNNNTQSGNSKEHKKKKGRKRAASAETMCKRQSSEGPSRKYTCKRRTKSAENQVLKENLDPKYCDKTNKGIMVRRSKNDICNDNATPRKRSRNIHQSDKVHSCSETKNTSQNDRMNETQPLDLETSYITAKPGTLKYLKQRQNVLETLTSETKTEDDFFSNPDALTSENMALYDDSDDSLTVKTPVGKAKRRNIPPSITPRTALIGQHCAITPTTRKGDSPKPFKKDKNCVLHEIYHLQELKKKKRKGKKGKKADPEEVSLKTNIDVTPLEFPRFEDKQVDEENVDDYFDESV
ncbi:uncharacterized protein LOC143040931 [Oratosquilla oratoria]|uniref:uncharacterized protein LOC143040931 n=1 Tax=Oratosquilla oratoria TaxID=337810 RepID=UPI003F7574E8